MFKHYLTYQMAVNLERSCAWLEVDRKTQHEVMRQARAFLNHLNQSLRTTDALTRSRLLATALYQLRDCRETVLASGAQPLDWMRMWETVHARAERLLEQAANAEKGQLRLFG